MIRRGFESRPRHAADSLSWTDCCVISKVPKKEPHIMSIFGLFELPNVDKLKAKYHVTRLIKAP